MNLVNEIEQLLSEDVIEPEAATRLILVSQREILESVTKLEEATEANSEYIAHYPSITWLWAHRRKGTVLVVALVFLALYFLLTPITISDWRHVILEAVGLPHDLGLDH